MEANTYAIADTGMPTDMVSTMLQMGITGIVMVCCGVFLYMLLKFYREIRSIEQTHQVSMTTSLSQCISQANEMVKGLATAAPLVSTVVAEARELVREAKELSESMDHQRWSGRGEEAKRERHTPNRND